MEPYNKKRFDFVANYLKSKKRASIFFFTFSVLMILFIIFFKSKIYFLQKTYSYFLFVLLISAIFFGLLLAFECIYSSITQKKLKNEIINLDEAGKAVLELFKRRKNPQRFFFRNSVVVNLQEKGLIILLGCKDSDTFLFNVTPIAEKIVSKNNFWFNSEDELMRVLKKNNLNPDFDLGW